MKNLVTAIFAVMAILNGYTSAEEALPPADRLAVGGKLDVDLHADLMVSRGDKDVAMNWYNCGYSAGTFGNFGLDVPYDKRAEKYPRWLMMDGSPAVFFNGDDCMKGDAPMEDTVVGDEDWALELWLQNEDIDKGECVLGWVSKDGSTTSASLTWQDFIPAGREWRHIVVNSATAEEKWYVDGEMKHAGPRTMRIEKGHVMILGGSSPNSPSYLGSIAAVRVHEKPLTEEQIKHNYNGGVMLGTKLFPNIDRTHGEKSTWGDENPEAYGLYETKHFRSRWEKAKDPNNEVIKLIPKQLAESEAFYDAYAHKLAIRMPVVSAHKQLRGDGVKYKIQLGNGYNLGAGGWMGWHGEKGFGYGISPSGRADGHELAHGCSGHMEGSLSGNYWEAFAGWPEIYAGIIEFPPGLNNLTSMFFPAHGRNYYHSRTMFEHLAQTPEYGAMFPSKLWHEAREVHYPWLVFQKCNPPTSLSDEWNRMARRNITWDYKDHAFYQKENKGPDLERFGRTILEPIPYDPTTWRVPKEMAPQQFGYNTCPLQPEGKKVSAVLTGYVNPERGSDWRASFVAVSRLGVPRYGNVFKPGEKAEFEINDDEPTLFLSVSATPTNIIDINMTGDYRSFEQEQFVYMVTLEGCKPLDNLVPGKPEVPGSPHRNGGGFVAATATVDPSAYVGPHAQVLGTSKVLGNARVEDYAVVTDATVRDNAIVSGHAFVGTGATVRDHAKVRDCGRVTEGSTVKNFAKVLEHATAGGRKTYSDYAVLKGMATSFGNVRGSAMIDGSYCKGNEIDKGKWFTWSWAQGKNDGEIDEDFGGLYAQYTFEKSHPYLAWDDFGVAWGYLAGGAKVVKDPERAKGGSAPEDGVLALDGEGQFIELPKDLADMSDITIKVDVKWDGKEGERILEFANPNGDALYLSPSLKGKCVFAIRKGKKEQSLKGPALPKGQWASVMVVLSGDTGRLYIDGKQVKRSDKMTFDPDDVRATLCFLGRGAKGNYLKGSLDNVAIYSIPLVDETPPSPDPAAFEIAPIFVAPGTVAMQAVRATVPSGTVEYCFEETSKNPGGVGSGWIKTAYYINEGLASGKEYSYQVKTRDRDGHETKLSQPVNAVWEAPEAFKIQKGPDSLIVIEAEHYVRKTGGSQGHEWSLTTDKPGYVGDGIMISLPNSGAEFAADFASVSPRMDYVVDFAKPGDYTIWLRGFGEHWTSDSVNMTLDMKPNPDTSDVQTGFGKYKWVRHGKPITVAQPGIHTISIWMKEDGSRLDRIVLTTNGDYKPTDQKDELDNVIGDGPAESPRSQSK